MMNPARKDATAIGVKKCVPIWENLQLRHASYDKQPVQHELESVVNSTVLLAKLTIVLTVYMLF